MNRHDHEALDSRDPNGWDACETGLLTGIARREQAAVAKARQTRVAGAALVAAAAVLLLAFIATKRGLGPKPQVWGDVYGGIACSECLDLMPAYHGHLVDAQPIAESDVASMKTHLAECPKCARYFNIEYPGVLASAAPAVTLTLAGLAGFFVLRRRIEDAS